MSRFLVTSSSNFTPFTYDELVKPIASLQKVENEAYDSYDKLISDTSILKNYLSDNDSETRRKLDEYEAQLNRLYESLNKSGYNPSVRRQLIAARKGYAEGPAYAAQLIAERQANSKDYWKQYHDHPETVMGTDPGTISLDAYWTNPEIGKQWYSYNGTTLAEEVATDISARTSELYRDAISKGPVPGYITRIIKEGITNEELMLGSTAAKSYLEGNTEALNNLNGPESIIAKVLIDRMNATGASYGKNGNVTKDSYDRLFDYAMLGASNAIKKPTIKDLEDKQWEFNKQAALAQIRAASSRKRDDEKPTEPGYVIDPTIPQILPESADIKTLRKLSNKFEKDNSGNVVPIRVNVPDGKGGVTSIPISSVEEMTDMIYNTQERQDILDALGFDIAQKGHDLIGTSDSRQESVVVQNINGKDVAARFDTARLSNKDAEDLGITTKNPVAVRQYINGKPVLNKDATILFNKKLEAHQSHVDELLKLNKDNLNLNTYAISPKEGKKIKEKEHINPSLQDSYIKTVLETRNSVSRRAPSVIADASEAMSDVRAEIYRNIKSTFSEEKAYAGNAFKSSDGSTADYALRPLNGYTVPKTGTTKMDSILSKDTDLLNVVVYPEDVLEGRVRITTNNGVYAVNATMLGYLYSNTINDPNFKNNVESMMRPLLKPDDVLVDKEDTYMKLTDDYTGQQYVVSAKDIVLNPHLQDVLYNGVIRYINQVLSHPRELKGQNHWQSIGRTSSKAEQYNRYMD